MGSRGGDGDVWIQGEENGRVERAFLPLLLYAMHPYHSYLARPSYQLFLLRFTIIPYHEWRAERRVISPNDVLLISARNASSLGMEDAFQILHDVAYSFHLPSGPYRRCLPGLADQTSRAAVCPRFRHSTFLA